MRIDEKAITQLRGAVKILLLISLLLFALSTAVMIGFIAFQRVLVPQIIGSFHDPQFIFPFFDFIQHLFFFCLLFMFTILVMQKSKEQNASIVLELLALFIVSVLTTLVSPILSNTMGALNTDQGVDYIVWYSGLSRFLYFSRLTVPVSFALYYIAISIQLVLSKISPQKEHTIEL